MKKVKEPKQFLPFSLSKDIHPLHLLDISIPDAQAFKQTYTNGLLAFQTSSSQRFTHFLFVCFCPPHAWISCCWSQDIGLNHTTVILGYLVFRKQMWDFLVSITMGHYSCNKSPFVSIYLSIIYLSSVYLSICLVSSVSLEKPNTMSFQILDVVSYFLEYIFSLTPFPFSLGS